MVLHPLFRGIMAIRVYGLVLPSVFWRCLPFPLSDVRTFRECSCLFLMFMGKGEVVPKY